MKPATGGTGDTSAPVESRIGAVLRWIIAQSETAGTPDALSVHMGTRTVDIQVSQQIFPTWCTSSGASEVRDQIDALGTTLLAKARCYPLSPDEEWMATISAYISPTLLSGTTDRS
jgi:hypothetical protein